MRLIVLKALVLFSVLCAGLHVPAAAHSAHTGQEDVSVHMAEAHFADAHEDSSDLSDSTSSEQAHDRLHQHNCPSTMDAGGFEQVQPLLGRADALRPDEAAMLASRALQPLTEPPLA